MVILSKKQLISGALLDFLANLHILIVEVAKFSEEQIGFHGETKEKSGKERRKMENETRKSEKRAKREKKD